MDIVEELLYFLLLCSTVSPLIFIFYKQGNKKPFYLSACLGNYIFITALLSFIILPIDIWLIKIAPQLAENGQLIYITPLIQLSDFIYQWWIVILHPILVIGFPIAIYKRYSIFHRQAANQ